MKIYTIYFINACYGTIHIFFLHFEVLQSFHPFKPHPFLTTNQLFRLVIQSTMDKSLTLHFLGPIIHPVQGAVQVFLLVSV